MNYKVVYFSRTGKSNRVAKKLADKLSCEAIQITDNINWNGILGFIKCGYYSLFDKDVDININGDIENSSEFILISPLWFGKIAPATSAFFKKIPKNKVHLVMTSNGSTLKNRVGFKSVNDIVGTKKNEDDVINSLVNKLS
jgi:flavodoxin